MYGLESLFGYGGYGAGGLDVFFLLFAGLSSTMTMGIWAFVIPMLLSLGLAKVLVNSGIRFFAFRKAGEAGWKAFVPFLGSFTFYKLVWDVRVYIATRVLLVASLILFFLVQLIDPRVGLVFGIIIFAVAMGVSGLAGLVSKLKILRAFDTKDWSYKGPAVKEGIGMPKFLANLNIGGMGGAPRRQPQAPQQAAYYDQGYQQPQQDYTQPRYRQGQQEYQAPQASQGYQNYQQYQAPQGYDQGYQQQPQAYGQPQYGQGYQQPQQGYEQPQNPGRRSARNNPPYGQY